MDRKFDNSEIKQAIKKYQSGNLEETINICHRIIKRQPKNFLALELLGVCAYKKDQIEQALTYYRESLKVNPNYAETHNNLAVVLQDNRQIDAAFSHCQAAIKLRPNYAEAWHNLGRILRDKGEFEAAIEHYQKSLKLKPNYAEAYNSLASIFLELGKFVESQKYYQEALKLDKNHFNAHFGLAAVLLKQGNFIQGFSEYEWRCKRQDYVTGNFAQPVWDGSDFSRKTLLVYTEQGLGDSIQFIRYIPLVKKLGGRVIVYCNKAGLKLLFTTVSEIDELFVIGEKLPDFDLQIPLMSLPRIFGTTLETIPAEIPYLSLPESKKIQLPETTNSFKIGITWETNSQIKTSKKRSCSVKDLQPILNLDNTRFYILQKEVSPQDLEWLKSQTKIHNLSSSFNDLADTAAVIKQLDLVITIDTVIAHLAGALGKPVWVMLNFDSDWRWLTDREDSPWYPTMRLFRQSKSDDWQGVCREVFNALSSKLLTFNQTYYSSIIKPGSSVTTQQLLTTAFEKYQGENLQEAEQICHFIIQHQPNCTGAFEILALCAKKTEKIDLEIAYHQKAINLNPNNYKTHLSLAIALKKQHKLELAIVHNQRAIELKQNDASAWHNLGLIFKIQGNIPEAIRCYKKSLEIQPNNVHIYYYWGNILKEQGNLTEAKVLYEKCLELNPNHINAHFAKGFILLKQGDFLAGFSEYEWRCKREDYITRSFAEPVWDGSDFSGKTLLIYTEQGLGDSIQFIRYVPLVKKLRGRVILECNQPGLKLLFTTVSEIDELFVEGEKLPDFDLQISLMSLPRILGTTLETIPTEIPYLSVPKSIDFSIPLAPEKNLKVGICWQTSSANETSQMRSCAVECLQGIINIDRVNFYILQKEVSVADLEWLKSQTQIHNLSSDFQDLADTAAAIKQLDLVITIDTVIAHLAGALGKPVWVMLNFDSDWRWLIDREDSPWYTTMRLFRQAKIGDWESVIKQIKDSLIDFLENTYPTEKVSRIRSLNLLDTGIKEALEKYKSHKIKETVNNYQKLLQTAVEKYKAGNVEEAEEICHLIIQEQPDFAGAFEILGLFAQKTGKTNLVITSCRKAISLNPNNEQTHLNLAIALKKNQEFNTAIVHNQKALSIKPNYVEAWHNLGDIFKEQGEITEAIRCYKKALSIKPNYPDVYQNWGNIEKAQGDFPAAKNLYQKALELDSEHIDVHFCLAVLLLKQGDFIQGFSEYEWRYQRKDYITRNFPQPVWDGSDFSGKTLLVYTEQGLGDSIQFIRYIPLVKKLGGHIIFESNRPELKFLFTTISEIDGLFVKGEKLSDFDLQVSLMSLPRIFQTTLETIPAEIPYLSVLKSIDFPIPLTPEKNLKVGICWQTNSTSDTSQIRSCSVEYLQEIINIDTANFYILQKEISRQDLEWLNSQTQIHNLSSYFKNLADTAAVIQQLDLVITIDTVIAHLAGALGKPVWVMLNFDSDWRWLTDREDSPWYPTMKLFRQSKIGDWDNVFVEVKQALIEFMESQQNLPDLPENFDQAYQYYQQNNLVEAAKICRRILAEKPQDFQVLHLLAVLEYLAGRNEVAIQLFNQVITLHPNSSQAYSNLGKIMTKEGRLEEAIQLTLRSANAHYQKAISLEANDSSNYSNLGNILKHQGRLEEAIAYYQKAISLEPNDSSNYGNLGFILFQKDRIESAIASYEKSLFLEPNNSQINLNLGYAWQRKGDLSKAITYYKKAINVQPNYALAYRCLGWIFLEQRNLTSSISHYQKALEIDPNFADAHFGLAMTLLLSGNLKEGFQEYHWRWQRWEIQKSLSLIQPEKLWDGSTLAGKIILLYAEQGYGDTIQFIRYLPLVEQQGGRIIFACQKPLIRLLEKISGIEKLIEEEVNYLSFDVHAPLLELPRIFGTTLDNIPPPIRNLNIPTVESIKLESPEINSLKVGIVWATKPGTSTYAKRSCKLIDFQSILDIAKTTFYSLQKDPGLDIQLLDTLPILDLSRKLNDFADTAGIITQLDLVITVDTAVAHLAGTLGKTVWILLPFVPDWRWMLDRNDSPWYPTARLFRQPKIGDWDSVFVEVKQALIEFRESQKELREKFDQAFQYYQENNLVEAEKICRRILAEKPQDFQALHLLAVLEYLVGRNEVAIQLLNQVITLRPNSSKGYSNLAKAMKNEGRLEEAIAHYKKAISLEPSNSNNHSSLGFIFRQQQNLTASTSHYMKVIEREPNNPNAHFSLAITLLLSGNLKEGFQEYHWWWHRWETQKSMSLVQLEKFWDGSNLAGKIILLHAEQGHGDTIQFIRYLPLVKKQGGKIILACQKLLIRLLEKFPGIEQCLQEEVNFITFDVHLPLLELPRIFGTTLDNIPPPIQNLNIPTVESIKLESPERNSLKVGIVWKTNPHNPTVTKRSCQLIDFQSILDIPGITFYSLQKDPGVDIQLLETLPILDLSNQLNDFADTAGIITQLDLVITVDTAVAHLAGTLGKTVWILLPFVPDWRWMLDRNDSPWYPTARLFRQPKIGDWDSVFIEVKQALIEFVESQQNLSDKRANFDLAYQYYQQNNLVEAEKICRRILAEKSQDSQVLHLLAVLEHLADRNGVAIQLLHQVITLHPNSSQAYSNLGKVLKKEGRLEEAIANYQKAISLQPNDSSNYSNLGLIFLEKGEIDAAIINYEKSRKINPENSCTNLNLGYAWEKKGDLLKASTYYQQAIKINPNYAEAWYNLGNILQKQGQLELAVEYCQKSLELNPDYIEAYHSLGFMFLELGKLVESQKYYEQALKLDKNHVNSHFGLASVLLKQGDFIAGFSKYEWRSKTKGFLCRNLSQPVWDGSNFPGKTLLVYTEQGLGDSIQFIRYIPLVKKLGGSVIVECNQPGLKLLFTTVSEIDELFVEGEKLPNFDWQIPLMSLPRIFRTTLETIPAEIPYLSVPKSIDFPIPLAPEKNLKVGICWQTKTSSTSDTSQVRSCSVEYLQAIINIDKVNFYILQKEVSVADLEWLNSQTQVHNLGKSFNDLTDTAAAIKQLDLVITIDTVIAHLAGALGKPVWVMLNFDSDWRWLTDREDSPWYPTMRLFRQSKIGDWDNVFVEVKQALIELRESQQKLPDLPANFDQAYQYYQQNNLVEATKICRRILAEKPQDFQALHLLAVLEHLAGRNEVAIQLLNQVININPNFSEAYLNLAKLTKKEGRLEEAIQLTLRSVIAHYQKAVSLQPSDSSNYSNLGEILKNEGRLEEAIAHYQKAISLESNDSSNYSNLGRLFLEKGQIDAAIINYEKSREINPNSSWININLGFAWEKKGDLSKAITYYQQTIKINPNYAEAWCNLGNLFHKQGKFELAVEYCQKSLELNPDYVKAYHELGLLFLKLGKLAESKKYYEQGLKLDKNHVNFNYYTQVYHNLGSIFCEEGNFTASISYYQKAIEIDPDFSDSHFNLSLVLLLLGDFKSGFEEYNWRWQAQESLSFIQHWEADKSLSLILPEKLWDGSNLAGKIILLHAEQGYGDTIQFIRYLPLVKQRGGRIILACYKPLVRLLEKIPEVEECVEIKVNFINVNSMNFDVHIPLLELPRIFGTTLDNIPSAIQNLNIPKIPSIRLESPEINSLKVGIVWMTNQNNSTAAKRSCKLRDFQSILDIAGITFYSLQKEPGADIQLLEKLSILDLSNQLNDFADTAGIITQLDLVITVDTAVAHLAGTLGKPVWILLPFVPDWRWMLDRNDSPWYPTARLFRQPKIGDWESVFIEVKQALIEFMESQQNLPDLPANFDQAYQYYQQNNLVEAAKICRRILGEKPQDFQALHLLAVLEHLAGRNEEAIQLLDRVISLQPNSSQAYLNLGKIFRDRGNLETAIKHYQKSLELNPDYIGIYNELGSIFFTLGQFTESQKFYEEAIKLDKNYVNAHFGLAGIFLKQGNFIPGFSKYEWRWKTEGFITRNLSQPLWDGSNFSGQTLLVYTEQGLGDSIQFIRYIPLVKKLGGRIIVECNKPPLKLIFTTVLGIDELFIRGEQLPNFDLQIPLMSLPRIFGTTLETIPGEIPYLSIPKSIDFSIPTTSEKNLKIGICWQTNSTSETSQVRSCPVEYLQEIININTANFYILQKEISVADLEWLNSQTKIHNLGSSFKDLTDTAAAIQKLDLVITIDTVIAHLAGALGKPVWVMLNFDSDWRWLIDRNDSPWYPSARLFRQPKIGDWNSVLKQVKESLENLLDNNFPTNKISERKPIKLPEEAIQKALAQYQSGKHKRNTPSSTFITSDKNSQTKTSISTINPKIKKSDNLKTSTSEIMKTIAINWPLNPMTGWGIYGINLTLQLLKNLEYQPLLLTPPSIQPGTLNPLHQALLNPAFNAQKNLQNQFKNHQGKKIKFNLPILQALGSNFSVSNNLLGTQNIGIIFSENTKFTSEQINRAQAYNLIITGSTWNTDILKSKGIKPVQKVLQGIEQTIFHPAPKSNIFGDRFVIFSGGKLEYRKGQDIVIAAFKIFQKRHPEALLITAWHNFWPQFMTGIEQTGNVVGLPKISQNKRLQITEWLLANDIPTNAVIDVGAIPNYMVGQILREANVAVFTNRCEGGTNLVAMESLACGIPTIISANTGHLDIINESHCYPLHCQKSVKPTSHFPGVEGWGESDVEEVVEMLEKVYSDPKDAQLRSNAAVNFMQDLTWEKQIQRLLVVLQNII